MKTLRFLLAPLAFLTLGGCSVFDSGEDIAPTSILPSATPPNPSATPTPVPTATPLPVLGAPLPVAPVVRWEPAELPLFTGEEHPAPYDRRTDDEPVWRLYEVGPKGGPRLVYETPRQPYDLEWTAGEASVRMGVTSRASTPTDDDEVWLRGLLEVGRDGSISLAGPLAPEGRYYEPSPVESPAGVATFVQVALQHLSGGPIYLHQASGEVAKLTGLGESTKFAGWTPDGKGLVVWVTQDNDGSKSSLQAADRALYLVALQDGVAQRMASGVSGWGSWSPNGTKLPILSGGEVFVFDRETGQARQLTTGAGYAAGFGARLRWSADGAYIAAHADLIDAASGQRLVRLITPGNEIGTMLTKDGRYFFASEDPLSPDALKPKEVCPRRLFNRTHVYDIESGQSRVLLDCDRGFFVPGAELAAQDGTHELLLRTFSCWGCDGARVSISVLTLESADVKRLTPDGESHGYVVSPDGSRFALTGATPKIMAADGETVLEEMQIPPGTSVYNVLWASDGVTYFYLLGPKQLALL